MENAEASSVLGYSSIGFEKTCTEAFDDLKAEQRTISTKVVEIVKLYKELKGKVEEGEELDASLRTELSLYSDAREDLVDSIMGWYERSGRAIAMNVDSLSKRHVGRVHDFVENMKRDLRKTKPLGKEENKDDDEMETWIKTRETNFPESIVKSGALDLNPLKMRLRGGSD